MRHPGFDSLSEEKDSNCWVKVCCRPGKKAANKLRVLGRKELCGFKAEKQKETLCVIMDEDDDDVNWTGGEEGTVWGERNG